MAGDLVARRLVLRGRVQGVGFRYFTAKAATGLGLNGWVRNLPDGSVEVLAQGAPASVKDLAARLTVGPASARVESLESVEAVVSEIVIDFSVR